MKSVRALLVKTLLIIALLALFSHHVSAFSTQGIVTGRIYEELADISNGILHEFYDIKLGWIRIEFEEFYNVPAGSTYSSPEVQANKQKFQNVINNAHAKGLKVLGIVANSAKPDIAGFPDTDQSILDFADCIQWHIDNYNVDAVQIWNEPGSNVAYTGYNLDRYAKTLIEVYSRLKHLYPDIIFAGPSTCNAERGAFLGDHGYGWDPENSIFNCTEMLNYRSSHNGSLPLDVVSWHPYGTGGNPHGNFYFGRDFTAYYNEILQYTDIQGRNVIGSYPIWFTEYGWDSNNIGLENQRIYTERMVTLIYARPQIELPFLYTYRDDGSSTGSEGKSFGIRTSLQTGSEKKRSYYPFAAHSSIVGLFTDDGINEWTVDQIVDEYLEMGGRDNFGDAYRHPYAPWYGDKAHYWGPGNNGVIQQFNYGYYGECGILMKWNIGTAYTVKGAIYDYYTANNGPYYFGWPTSREYPEGDIVWQDFEFGKMKWSPIEGVTWHPE